MKIGLFFGSFNPIHVGHLIIAETIVADTDLDQLWFVVTPQNPFKRNKSLLDESERLLMVERAIADNFKLKASDVEFSMPKPSYTIDTLTVLSDKHPEHEFILIMGEDNLVQFKNWKNYQMILDNYRTYIYPRPNTPEHDFKNHPKINFIQAPLLDISATYIRKRIHMNKDIKYLVTEPVEELIYLKKHYS